MTHLALILLSASTTFHLPPGMLSAVCYVESHHRPEAVHLNDGGGDSLGLCQIKVETARSIGYTGSAYYLHHKPRVNAYWAAKYLDKQLLRYRGDVRCAAAAYSAGACRRDAKGRIRNSEYVRKVFIAWAEGK